MTVDAAQTRNIQHHLRQDQPVGDHHHQVGLQGGQFRLGGRITQGLRLKDRDAVLDRQLLHRAGHQLLATSGRAVGLGVDGHHLAARIKQGLQVLGGEFRGAGEDDTHGSSLTKKACRSKPLGSDHACWRCCFSSFFLMRSRLSCDR